jgi:hypothetical protein
MGRDGHRPLLWQIRRRVNGETAVSITGTDSNVSILMSFPANKTGTSQIVIGEVSNIATSSLYFSSGTVTITTLTPTTIAGTFVLKGGVHSVTGTFNPYTTVNLG